MEEFQKLVNSGQISKIIDEKMQEIKKISEKKSVTTYPNLDQEVLSNNFDKTRIAK